MKFGITKFENFDPVQDIDLDKATVTIDAKFTNLGMFNYEPAAWDDIRKAFAMVPLNHPLWRPHEELGLKPWAVPVNTTTRPSIPEPEFDLPLLPLELWIPDDDTVPRSHHPIHCPSCPGTFNSIGALIHHCQCRECPGLQDHDEDNSSSDSDNDCSLDQDAVDKAYWEKYSDAFKCPICGFVPTQKAAIFMAEHMTIHSDERPFECDFPGCGKNFKSKIRLTAHRLIHQKDRPRPHKCDECGKAFTTKASLERHKKSHSNQREFECHICGKKSNTKGNLRSHLETHSQVGQFVCDEPGCEAKYKRKTDLHRHQRQNGHGEN
ncbi:hypothetical protein ACHAPI_011468 [Fusarium lateritium]